jgi:hypothetical protein
MESALRWIGEAAKDLSGPIAIILAVALTARIIIGVWQMISTDKREMKKSEKQERLELIKVASTLLGACLAARMYIREEGPSRDNILMQLDNAIELAEGDSTLYPTI